jgi:protease I
MGEGNMASASSFLEIARSTGVEILQDGAATIWQGPYSGTMKPTGPLCGKTIGVIVASEFSDWQAYYLMSYLSEFGAKCEFLVVDWVKWKWTRPNVRTKGVVGMWGLSVDPNPTIPPGGRYHHKPLKEADPKDYQAIISLGGYAADIMMTEEEVIAFIRHANQNGAFVGAIGSGSIPLITAGIMDGKKATGNAVVAFMIKKIGQFMSTATVRDDLIITARDTVDTAEFVRALCKAFDPSYIPRRKGIVSGQRVLILTTDEFEDIELVVPVMELIYRGAIVTIATFPPPVRNRPPLLGLDVIVGAFGITVPLQEIPQSYYHLTSLKEVTMDDFDLLLIPGGFNPWNMIVAGEPIEFLKRAYAAGKVIGVICHSEIAAAAADLLEGKKTCGWLACKPSVEIMGGDYSFERSAIIDGNLVSGRTPNDVPEFLDACTEALLRK